MEHFQLENLENSRGPSMRHDAEFLLIEALKQKLINEPSMSNLTPQHLVAEKKALELKEKLDQMSKRLANGFKLIKAKFKN
jgi:hypothetical protein